MSRRSDVDNRKTVNHLDDVVVKLRQSWNDRSDCPPTKISERYLRNVVMIALEFSLKIFGSNFVVRGFISHDVLVERTGDIQLDIRRNDDQLPVFIENVHTVKDQKGAIERVGGFIGLQIPNEGTGVRICDSLYFSFVTRNFLFVDRFILKNGELDLTKVLLSGGSIRELPNDVIQAGSQMVNDFPREHFESHRDGPISVILHSIKNSIIVYIGHDWVFAGLKKEADFSLKITDVLVGPF